MTDAFLQLDEGGLPYWLDVDRPTYPPLEDSVTADVAIVGAGVCGVKLAHAISRHGVEVIVVDGGRVGEGASGRNQGCMTYGLGSYTAFIEQHSRPVARDLWKLGCESRRMIREQIDEYGIDCDYEENGAYYIARHDLIDADRQIEEWRIDQQLLVEDGIDASLIDEVDVRERSGSPFPHVGFGYNDAAQFHSGKFITGLAAGVAQKPGITICEGTRVEWIERFGGRTVLHTPRGRIDAGEAFLALNAMTPQLLPHLERPLRAERGQVLVTEPLAERPCRGCWGGPMAWWREVIDSDGRFRLLFGGARTRDEPDSLFPQFNPDGSPHPKLETEGFRPSVEHQQRLHEQLALCFPHLADVRITHRWGGLQSFTADDLPILGLFDPETRVHGVAGLSGLGNCFGNAAAEYLAGRALGIESGIERRYGHVFEKLLLPDRPSANWGPWQRGH